jgi:hypothetical protein
MPDKSRETKIEKLLEYYRALSPAQRALVLRCAEVLKATEHEPASVQRDVERFMRIGIEAAAPEPAHVAK